MYIIYWFYFFSAMIIAGIAKEYNLFAGAYAALGRFVKSKRGLAAIYSTCSGILPIPGRIVVSTAALDTIAPQTKKRQERLSVLSYLSSHHYYFWSPLEATVMLPIAVLGVSYWDLIGYLWPLVVGYLSYMAWYIYRTPESDIEITIPESTRSPGHIVPFLASVAIIPLGVPGYLSLTLAALYYIIVAKVYSFKKICSYIKWKLVGVLLVVSILGYSIQGPLGDWTAKILESSSLSLYVALVFSWIAAFIMGSSAKAIGIVAILCTLFGIEYLPLFFAIEFSAYFLSPFHRCIPISVMYFNTTKWGFYRGILPVVAIIIGCGLFAVAFL